MTGGGVRGQYRGGCGGVHGGVRMGWGWAEEGLVVFGAVGVVGGVTGEGWMGRGVGGGVMVGGAWSGWRVGGGTTDGWRVSGGVKGGGWSGRGDWSSVCW